MARSCKVAVDSVNVNKNRYLDVVPWLFLIHVRIIDHRREDIYKCKPHHENISRFIATQGPLPHTYEDFWEMIILHHCPVIVMLTRLVDNYETVKCGDYFQAEDGPRDFGNISIVTKWVKTTDTSLLLRSLDVGYKEMQELSLVSGVHLWWKTRDQGTGTVPFWQLGSC
uniref:Tyrosine-protein phosphatase domain-containing protein n=1 Tax=Populus trichocarpa TaxID=3694 RepID=A0A2K1WRN7_POPTR